MKFEPRAPAEWIAECDTCGVWKNRVMNLLGFSLSRCFASLCWKVVSWSDLFLKQLQEENLV